MRQRTFKISASPTVTLDDIAFALQRIGIQVIKGEDLLIVHKPRRDGIAEIAEGADQLLPCFLRLQCGPPPGSIDWVEPLRDVEDSAQEAAA